MCACCLIRTWCDPDEGVEGGPAAKGNLVIPSPTLLSSSEEEEEETDKAIGGQAPAGGKQYPGLPSRPASSFQARLKLEAGLEGSPGAKAEEELGGDELGQVGGSLLIANMTSLEDELREREEAQGGASCLKISRLV